MSTDAGTPTPRVDALMLEINEGRTYDTIGPLQKLAEQLERELAALRTAHAARLDRVEAERNAYRSFYIGVSDSFDDTWQCEGCGHAEPWWTDCNADYATRDAVLAISAEGAGWQGKEAK